MSKKIVLSSLLIGLIVVFLTCDLNKKSIEWVPTLDDTTVYGLNKQISDLRKNLETFQQFQKKGQRVKANEQMTILNKGLENLDNYYLPLTNARAHLSSAYKLSLRNDLTRAKEEFTKSQQQILAIKSKATGNVLKDINGLLLSYGTLEKEFDAPKKNLKPLFIEVSGQLAGLIAKKI
jgi:septation ring formation regulator EzrA